MMSIARCAREAKGSLCTTRSMSSPRWMRAASRPQTLLTAAPFTRLSTSIFRGPTKAYKYNLGGRSIAVWLCGGGERRERRGAAAETAPTARADDDGVAPDHLPGPVGGRDL